MKRLLFFAGLAVLLAGCGDEFLAEEPVGELTEEQVRDSTRLEGIVVSAYSILNGQLDNASNAYNSPPSNWSFSDIVSDDAYKGGGGTGDQNNMHQMEIFSADPSTIDIERKWLALYEGVRRANIAIQRLNQSDQISEQLRSQRVAEMRFLRGHFFFELKKLYNNIVWVEETASAREDYLTSNTEFSSEELWERILNEFQQAYNVLPRDQADPGRPTKMAARAYMAKVHIFQENWSQAHEALNEVIDSGKYRLMDDFRAAFVPENDNGPEVIFAIQYSIRDGAPNNYNGSIGYRTVEGQPASQQYGFQRPSQNFVNAMITTTQGLPAHKQDDLTNEDYVDPRLDFTVGRPGVPFLDVGMYDSTWARELAVYGPYIQRKRIVSPNSSHYLSVWPYTNDLNYYIIRYADVLLWKAEAAIEMGDLGTGREYINMIRQRAKESDYVQALDGSQNAANYRIEPYDQPFASYDEAIQALRTERRLEMAMEGHRFFDLVRWGMAAEVINAYIAEAQEEQEYLRGAAFEEGKHEYYPIPQTQMDLSQGLLTQNPGYN